MRFTVLKADFLEGKICDRVLPSLKVGVLEPAVEPSIVLEVCVSVKEGCQLEDGLQIYFPKKGDLQYLNFVEIPGRQNQKGGIARRLILLECEVNQREIEIYYADGRHVHGPFVSVSYGDDGIWRAISEFSDAVQIVDLTSQTHSPSYVWVGGAPKSGTTWVENILNAHSSVLVRGENMFFSWPDIDSLEGLLKGVPPSRFSQLVRQNAPFRSNALMFYRGRAESILNQYAMIGNYILIGDKSPTIGFDLALRVWPDLQYVHAVRHPLDVCVSRFFHERTLLKREPELTILTAGQKEFVSGTLRPNQTLHCGEMFAKLGLLETFLGEWIKIQRAYQIAKKWAPKRVHLVKYEELKKCPEKAIADLFLNLHIELDQKQLNNIVHKTKFTMFTNGRQSGVADNSSFYRNGIVGDYKNYMNGSQIEYAKKYINKRIPEIHYEFE